MAASINETHEAFARQANRIAAAVMAEPPSEVAFNAAVSALLVTAAQMVMNRAGMPADFEAARAPSGDMIAAIERRLQLYRERN